MLWSFFHYPVIRSFIFRFIFIFVGMELLLYWFPPIGYQTWIATQIGNLLHVSVDQTFLGVEGSFFEISAFCSGFTTFALFAGLVLGFNVPSVERKIRLLISGGLFIFALNFIRIYFVVWIGKMYSIGAAEAVHVLSWFVLSALVMGLWFLLMKKETGARTQRELARRLIGN